MDREITKGVRAARSVRECVGGRMQRPGGYDEKDSDAWVASIKMGTGHTQVYRSKAWAIRR